MSSCPVHTAPDSSPQFPPRQPAQADPLSDTITTHWIYFLIRGPFIAAFLLIVVTVFFPFGRFPSIWQLRLLDIPLAIVKLIGPALFVTLFSYFLGWIPASATGVVSGYLAHSSASRMKHFTWTAAAGFITSFVFFFLLSYLLSPRPMHSLEIVCFLGILGAATAGVCCLLHFRSSGPSSIEKSALPKTEES